MKEEIWKDIPDYEGLYQVSDFGKVKRLPKKTFNGKCYFISKQIILKPYVNGKYEYINLIKNKKSKTFTVHKLMAITFLDYKSCKSNNLVVDHIDNNQLNNNLKNLQIITNRENTSKDRLGYSSSFIGVSWCKTSKKWVANITINKKQVFLGSFNQEINASVVYNRALYNLEKYNGCRKSFRELNNI